jgi:hypothetical protein
VPWHSTLDLEEPIDLVESKNYILAEYHTTCVPVCISRTLVLVCRSAPFFMASNPSPSTNFAGLQFKHFMLGRAHTIW